MGYAGGDRAEPDYRHIGDHTECFQVDFDPDVISYTELVDLALASHDPTRAAHKPQYASVILAHDAEQLALASQRADRSAAAAGVQRLATRIEPLKQFWLAEDYHQKYHLRHDRTLMSDFGAMFGVDQEAFRESTAAARVNGYIAGYGRKSRLSSEIPFLGLSDSGRSRLVTAVDSSGDGIGCSVG